MRGFQGMERPRHQTGKDRASEGLSARLFVDRIVLSIASVVYFLHVFVRMSTQHYINTY